MKFLPGGAGGDTLFSYTRLPIFGGPRGSWEIFNAVYLPGSSLFHNQFTRQRKHTQQGHTTAGVMLPAPDVGLPIPSLPLAKLFQLEKKITLVPPLPFLPRGAIMKLYVKTP